MMLNNTHNATIDKFYNSPVFNSHVSTHIQSVHFKIVNFIVYCFTNAKYKTRDWKRNGSVWMGLEKHNDFPIGGQRCKVIAQPQWVFFLQFFVGTGFILWGLLITYILDFIWPFPWGLSQGGSRACLLACARVKIFTLGPKWNLCFMSCSRREVPIAMSLVYSAGQPPAPITNLIPNIGCFCSLPISRPPVFWGQSHFILDRKWLVFCASHSEM